MNPEARNLQRISEAIDQHSERCGAPLVAVLLSPFELDRIDWDEIRGVKLRADDTLPTGRFRLLCSGQHNEGEQAEAAAEAPRVGELVKAT